MRNGITIRESNFELLRIMAMLLICILHTSNWCMTDTKAALLSSFSVIGVNLFVMITGWWGVHNPLKSILKIWIEVASLKIICCIVFSMLHATPISIMDMARSFWMGGYWFVTAYVGLLLFSPILERALELKQNESEHDWIRKFTIIIVLLTVMNCVFGWLLKGVQINATGQTFVQMIYIYICEVFEASNGLWYLKCELSKVLCCICVLLGVDVCRLFGCSGQITFTWSKHGLVSL